MLALPFLTQAAPGSPRAPSPPAGDTRPVASTTILPGPEGGKEAFEPSLTIDPAKPDRMVVVAMYGNPMAHGGRAIWVWDTGDGGRSWTGGRMRPPTVASKPATWAADVVAGIGRDGATVLTAMAGAHSPRTDGLGGIAVARRVRGDTAFAPAVLVMRDRLIDATDQATIYDKPWMTIDRHESSPYRGAVYVVAGAMDLPLPQRSWAETPLPLSQIKILGMDFAVSRDDGRTFGPPRRIADSAFPADLTVSPSGSLEVVYSQSVGGGSAIVHLRSTDGGASFEPPARIATAGTGGSVGGPMVAARPNGDLMACWAETSAAAVRRDRLRCAERRAGGDWAEGESLAVSLPANAAYGLPALVGTARAWYLLLYLIDSARTEVAVFRSTGRVDFSKLETLATAPGLGLSEWCLTRECKLSRHDRFTPGDYAALAGSGGRLAAAYVLPRPGGPLFGSAAVHVSLLTEP